MGHTDQGRLPEWRKNAKGRKLSDSPKTVPILDSPARVALSQPLGNSLGALKG